LSRGGDAGSAELGPEKPQYTLKEAQEPGDEAAAVAAA